MTEESYQCFVFGEFRLDPRRRILQKDGSPLHLTPRSFDLLCVLVEHAGQVLTHDALLDRVWAGAFVEQGNLKKAVSGLRQVLGETAGSSQFVTTVPRQGYSFTAPVRAVPPESVLIRETRTEIWVQEDIEIEPDVPVALPAPSPRQAFGGMRTMVWAGGAALMLAVATIAAWPYLRPRPLRFSMDKVEVTRLTSENSVLWGGISADGTLYAYAVNQGKDRSLWVRQVTTGSAVQAVPPGDVSFWHTVFSPDNSYVYYTFVDHADASRNGVYRVPALGGMPRVIANELLYDLKFSPDGKRLAAFRTINQEGQEIQQLLTISAEGGDLQVVRTLPAASLLRGIAWSPDGRSLLYGVKHQPPNQKAVYSLVEFPLAGGVESIVLPEQERILYVEAWLPDRHSILLRERSPSADTYQIDQFFPSTGEWARITRDDYSYTSLSLSRDGATLSAVRSLGLYSIWAGDAAKPDLRQLAAGPNAAYDLDWTPAGQLVFATTENDHAYLAVMNSDGGQRRLLTDGADGFYLDPRVSGDGRHITILSIRSGGPQLWRLNLDGGEPTQVTHGEVVGDGVMLADGTTAIYSVYRQADSTWELVKQTADGQTVPVTTTDTEDWAISPDEKFLAVSISDQREQPKHLEIRELATGRIVKTFDWPEIDSLRWTTDGKALSFIEVRGESQVIVSLPIDGGPEKIVTTLRGERLVQFAWSRDGKQIAVVRSKDESEAVLLRAGKQP
jgi:DNA-binding winged helix-turn-helix (wHTH) protein/Tol biopolymer transport system component